MSARSSLRLHWLRSATLLLSLLLGFLALPTQAQTTSYSRPTITSFSPASGPVGSVVTVNGSGFTGTSSVRLGTVAASFTVVSSTQLRFTVPSGAVTATFRVRNPSYSTLSSSAFTVTTAPTASYPQPMIGPHSPTSGPVGTVVTITGSGFTGLSAVWFGNDHNAPFTVVSDTEVRATITAAATTSGPAVLNPQYASFSPLLFTVTAGSTPTPTLPSVSGFTPASGPAGTVVTVSGSNLVGATGVTVGASAMTAVSSVSSGALSFTVPSSATTGAIKVYNASGSGSSVASFTLTTPAPVPVPAISSFSPASGPVGTVVTVTGTGFAGATGASIGSSAQVAVSNVTATSLSFTVPAGAASGTIKVYNASYSGSSSASFTVTVPAAQPVVSSFSPASGAVGTLVTVTGSGFTGATSVTLGGIAAGSLTVYSDTVASFTVPVAAISGVIRIANPTSSGSSATSFTLISAPTGPGLPMGTTAAARLLSQASFGPTLTSLDAAAAQSYDAWFATQALAPISLTLPGVAASNGNWVPFWWQNIVTGPDQLRQRLAFALSEIFVVSDQSGAIIHQNRSLAMYYDLLAQNAFGNFRTLLEKVTLSPTMGLYLNMFRNNKPDPVTGVHADQNYAREVMQLFTIGLVKLNPDGTVQKDANGVPVPTYSQADVEGMSRVLTGWASNPVTGGGEGSWIYDIDYVNPMVAYENHHDTSAKTIVGGVTVPAGGTAAQDLKIALDTLFNHPNVGPFISLRLIQRLVTSNPSPAYVGRVAAVFNNNGSGVRGDLLAVAKAILTDPEAVTTGDNTYGKLREPLIRMASLWRAFSATDSSGNVAEYGVLLMSGENFAQSVLDSPSVFNFFAPDYQRAGSLTFAGMVAPEFQTANENTLVLTANMIQRAAYQFIDSKGVANAGPNGYSETNTLNATSVMLKTAAWEPYASDPAALVDKFNLVFMQGLMPAAMRSTLINYATAVPASAPASRVIETVDLLVNSPQYAVQR